jgi:hypothetical protein
VDKFTRRKRSSRIIELVEEVEVRLESCLNVEPSVSPLLGILEKEARLEDDDILSR